MDSICKYATKICKNMRQIIIMPKKAKYAEVHILQIFDIYALPTLLMQIMRLIVNF